MLPGVIVLDSRSFKVGCGGSRCACVVDRKTQAMLYEVGQCGGLAQFARRGGTMSFLAAECFRASERDMSSVADHAARIFALCPSQAEILFVGNASAAGTTAISPQYYSSIE